MTVRAGLCWPPASNFADNQVHHLYSRIDLVTAGHWLPEAAAFRDRLGQFDAPVHDAWLSRIQPGGYIVPHTDRSRWRERWHIPIQPAGNTLLTDDTITEEHVTTGDVGVPFRLKHWLPHSVVNDSDRDRIHLIIDLDRYVGPDEARPFTLL